jgi:MFS family permease
MNLKDWLNILTLALAGTFLGTVFAIVSPVLPLIAQHYGGGREGAFVAEWVLTMPSIGLFVGGPVSGWLVERFGARAVLLTCFLVFGAAGLAGLMIENSNLLLAARFVAGLSAAGQVTAATAVAGDRFVGERRGFVLGFQVALAAILGILMTLVAGALAQHFGWRAPFALYGLSVLTALLAAFCVERLPERPSVVTLVGSTGLLPLLPLFFAAMVTMIVAFISTNEIPMLLSEQGASDPTLQSYIQAGNTLTTILGALLYSRMRPEFGSVRTSAVGGGVQAAALLVLALSPSVQMTVLSSLMLGVGNGMLYPGFSHAILDRAPGAARGRAIGLLTSTQFLGTFLSTALVIPAIDTVGRELSLLVIGGAVFIGWLTYAAGSARARTPNLRRWEANRQGVRVDSRWRK